MNDATVTKKCKNLKAAKLLPVGLVDQLLARVQSKDVESSVGESGLACQLKKYLDERMLAAELNHHLEAEAEQGEAGNYDNGISPRTVLTSKGELKLDIPRDRQATFEPQLMGKYQRRLPGFDHHDVARGQIQQFAGGLVTGVAELGALTLEAMYPIVLFDAKQLKIRDEGTVKSKAAHLVLGDGP